MRSGSERVSLAEMAHVEVEDAVQGRGRARRPKMQLQRVVVPANSSRLASLMRATHTTMSRPDVRQASSIGVGADFEFPADFLEPDDDDDDDDDQPVYPDLARADEDVKPDVGDVASVMDEIVVADDVDDALGHEYGIADDDGMHVVDAGDPQPSYIVEEELLPHDAHVYYLEQYNKLFHCSVPIGRAPVERLQRIRNHPVRRPQRRLFGATTMVEHNKKWTYTKVLDMMAASRDPECDGQLSSVSDPMLPMLRTTNEQPPIVVRMHYAAMRHENRKFTAQSSRIPAVMDKESATCKRCNMRIFMTMCKVRQCISYTAPETPGDLPKAVFTCPICREEGVVDAES